VPNHFSPERERPTMASHRLDLPSRCDICGKARSTRKHQACSRIRQQRKSAEWAAFMAEREAAKQKKPRRYAH
jgi:predicted nucleic acid binding AN1-type Zn finger protein